MNKSNLRVHYRANEKAWMDEKIFRERLYKFDAQMNIISYIQKYYISETLKDTQEVEEGESVDETQPLITKKLEIC